MRAPFQIVARLFAIEDQLHMEPFYKVQQTSLSAVIFFSNILCYSSRHVMRSTVICNKYYTECGARKRTKCSQWKVTVLRRSITRVASQRS